MFSRAWRQRLGLTVVAVLVVEETELLEVPHRDPRTIQHLRALGARHQAPRGSGEVGSVVERQRGPDLGVVGAGCRRRALGRQRAVVSHRACRL